MRSLWSHIGICLALSSCVPDPLPVDNVPLPEKTIVIGSQNIPDEFMAIAVSENFTPLQGGRQSNLDSLVQELLVDSLEIMIEVEQEKYMMDFNPSRGIYLASNIPDIPGATYTLSTINPFNGELTQATTSNMPFIGFDTLALIIDRTPFDTLMQVNMRVEDPAGPNWYMINVQTFNDDYNITDRPFTDLLSDENFDGQLYNHSFNVFFRDYSKGDTVLVSMTNISKDYFDFLQLRYDQRFAFDGLGEPVNYNSNVINGLGYFHLHIPDIRLITPNE